MDFNIAIMNMVNDFKKGINSLTNSMKQKEELTKRVQDIKVDIKSLQKTQVEINLETESLGSQEKTSEINFTNTLEDMKENLRY